MPADEHLDILIWAEHAHDGRPREAGYVIRILIVPAGSAPPHDDAKPLHHSITRADLPELLAGLRAMLGEFHLEDRTT